METGLNRRDDGLGARIAAAGLFDAEWYVARYGDVEGTGLDPLEDFLRFGLALGRDPGPRFSVAEYLRRVPAAADHPGGAVAHYLTAGQAAHPLPVVAPLSDGPGSSEAASQRWAQARSGNLGLGLNVCQINDFRLIVRGWVLDALRPEVVHRLVLRLGDMVSAPVIARRIVTEIGDAEGPLQSGIFELAMVVPDHLMGQEVVLEVLDSGASWTITPDVNPPLAEDLPALQAVLAQDVIMGRVLKATTAQVSGWAFVRATRSAEGVELVLKINGRPFAVTRCNIYRPDIQQVRGGDGFCGFQFMLPDNLWTGAPLDYEIVSTQGQARLTFGTGTLSPPAGLWVPATVPAADPPLELVADLDPEPEVSVIILNRNGRGILEDMLLTAEGTGDLARAEWIVIDHQSSDGSVAMCEGFAARGFGVRVVPRNGNFSFSESNNFGARLARGRTLVFANNDLLFTAPVMDRVIAGLRHSRIGVLGAELVDNVAAPEWHEAAGGTVVQHHGVHFRPRMVSGHLRPFEARHSDDQPVQAGQYHLRPAVTAAFIAMRRDDFERIGGFDEDYGYGLEDVDLSLKVMRDLGLASVLDAGLQIIHRHGYSRQKDVHASPQRVRNNLVLNRTWGTWLRRQVREGGLARTAFWTGRRPVVGFTVTSLEVGDYYTALELGRALQTLTAAHVVYLPQEDWHDLSGVDVVINVSPRFDLHRVKTINPFAVTVNWMRQHFDTWLARDSIHSFDHVICSSRRSADFFQARMTTTVHMMPIASDTAAFAEGRRREELASDYCFTGSYFNVNREIQFNLDPAAIKGQGAVFGKDWEGTSLAAISRGPLPYDAMADVYASTRIVIDDGIFATAPWGSVNSRVFDALAAGCLVLTNNHVGAAELFGDLLPTYSDRESLTAAINWWLAHEEERQERVRLLQQIVRERHDYRHRAAQVLDILSSGTPLRIALKCAARQDGKEFWGDYHFCQSLARALRELGAVVRVDVLEDWNSALTEADDVVITLRGLSTYEPMPHQINLVWLISHPEDVSLSELAKYDHVLVASAPFAARLARDLDVPVTTLQQCTDTDLFPFDPARVGGRPDRAVFVGNSRGVFRTVVRWAIEQELDVDLYGGGWESFVKDDRLKGASVPNEVLGGLYASSRVVLCDHWTDMARHGFLSNRAFDVLGSGGFLVTDAVAGMEELLPAGSYAVFGTAEELAEQVRMARPVDVEARRAVADWVRENHSFRARARQILDIVKAHPKLRAWAA